MSTSLEKLTYGSNPKHIDSKTDSLRTIAVYLCYRNEIKIRPTSALLTFTIYCGFHRKVCQRILPTTSNLIYWPNTHKWASGLVSCSNYFDFITYTCFILFHFTVICYLLRWDMEGRFGGHALWNCQCHYILCMWSPAYLQ